MTEPTESGEPAWLVVGRELRAIAQIGLTFSKDPFDRQRFVRIRELGASLIAQGSDAAPARVLDLFNQDVGYATPKVDVRGAAFRDGRVLLVREISDGRWTLPGGWADVNQTPAECVVREVREESGFEARTLKLAAVHDYRRRNPPRNLDSIYKLLFVCELTGGSARASDETSEVAFFAPRELPPLSLGRTTPQQIELMFPACRRSRTAHRIRLTRRHALAFRLRAFGMHLLVSAAVLGVLLGTLYLGWYRWPGWYLADASQVVLVMIGVDVVVGPLLTFVIASASKPRRALARDLAVIAVVQLVALLYGSLNLWHGRPLYYAFSENVLQLVQAYDIEAAEIERARPQNAALLPHWYSLPRWIWAPLPQDPAARGRIIASAVSGGDDVISMPRYYQPWEAGLAQLRTQLKKVDDVGYFMPKDKQILKEKMRAAGLAPEQTNAIPLTGRGRPLLAVFDPAGTRPRAIFEVK